MKIQLISTGYVRITQNWRVGKGEGLARIANTIFDEQHTDWLPVYCAVIDHPDGLILVDTGSAADAGRPIFFPPHLLLMQRAVSFEISPEEEIGVKMQRFGYDPKDVRSVILTHLHQDHDGGMHHFPNAEFLIARQEWAAALGWGGRMNGYQPWHWSGITPRLIDFESGAYHNFASSEAIAADIRLVPTPGHSLGHLSVIVEQGSEAVMLAGDSAYTDDLLVQDRVDGIGPSPTDQHETHRRITAFAEQVPTIFLPTHDPLSAERLEKRITLPGKREYQLSY